MPTVLLRLSLLLLAGSVLAAGSAAASTDGLAPLHGARQLVVVTSAGWDADHGQLQAFQHDGQRWQAHGAAFDVALGRSGSGWGIGLHPASADGPHKREGDGRSPAGIFAIGSGFGYAASGIGALPYQAMAADHWCMDVPASPLYNRIVDARQVGSAAVAGSSEPMRLDLANDGDIRYRNGFVIAHNPDNQPGAGSCIFAHLRRNPVETTAGCTAMDAAAMEALLRWLDPAAQPRFVLLPQAQYRQLQAAWQLPALDSTGH